MENLLEQRYFIALVMTILVVVMVIIIGKIIDDIVSCIIRFTVRRFGKTITMLIANRITFLGTVHHELAHAIFAFCTGAKIVEISLFYPKGPTLGNVKYVARGNEIFKSIQHTMSAIAPVICGCITEYLLYTKVLGSCTETWQTVCTVFIMISILMHMTMSNQDIKMAIKGLPWCMVILYVIMYITEFNIRNLLIK